MALALFHRAKYADNETLVSLFCKPRLMLI